MEKYFVLRYFLIPIESSLFKNRPSKIEEEKIITQIFNAESNYITPFQIEYIITGMKTIHSRLIYAKLGKRKDILIHKKTKDDIQNDKEESWPFLQFVLDLKTQTIFIENPNKIYISLKQLSNILTEFFRPSSIPKGYEVSIELVVNKGVFWETIKQYPYLFSIKFELNAPNLFGANSKANESLKEIKEIFNNTSATFLMKNKQGKLKAIKDNIQTFIDYCENGGGNWETTVAKEVKKHNAKKKVEKGPGKKVRYRSIDNPFFHTINISLLVDSKGLDNFLEEIDQIFGKYSDD
jgi:hypothetical protein